MQFSFGDLIEPVSGSFFFTINHHPPQQKGRFSQKTEGALSPGLSTQH
jgi:hypothetical protein